MQCPTCSQRLATVVVLSATVLAIAACNGAESGGDEDQQAAVNGLMNEVTGAMCDTEEFRQLADQVVGSLRGEGGPDTASLFLISGPDLNNSQVHDCQRLIDSTAVSGDLMAEKPLVALLVRRGRVQAGPDVFAQGVVVADIINYGPGIYEPLGIPEGLSCLWIRVGREEGTPRIAAARSAGPDGCGATQFSSQPSDPLEVRPLPIQRGEAEYPSTGRWMWDSVNRQQFIGIRCGRAWCEIGATGFVGTGSIAESDSVPGWYDEQLLAVPRRGDGRLVLSGLYGRIGPGDDNRVAESRTPVPRPDDSLHVATMTFEGSDTMAWETYATKFDLDRDGMDAQHEIYLSTVIGPTGQIVWRVRSPQSPWTPASRGASQHSGSGTVRWAWSDADEGFWVPCDAGCCISTGVLGGP